MASVDARPSKRAKVDYTDTIQVLVGAEESAFTVHKDTITKRSPFFRAALAHDFTEAHEKRVRLPSCDHETFNTYLGCLYYEADDMLRVDKDEIYSDQYFALTKLYILADRLCDIRLCNSIVDHLQGGVVTAPSAEMVKPIYETFPSEHKMRDFVVALCMDQCDVLWLPDNRKELPEDFVFDYAVKCSERLDEMKADEDRERKMYIDQGDCCSWHQHDVEVPQAECELVEG